MNSSAICFPQLAEIVPGSVLSPRVRPASWLNMEIAPPGTEFLNAETGACNRPMRPLVFSETEKAVKCCPNSRQKRPLSEQGQICQFGATEWWCAQSYANRSQPAKPCYSLLFAFFRDKDPLPFFCWQAAPFMFLRIIYDELLTLEGLAEAIESA